MATTFSLTWSEIKKKKSNCGFLNNGVTPAFFKREGMYDVSRDSMTMVRITGKRSCRCLLKKLKSKAWFRQDLAHVCQYFIDSSWFEDINLTINGVIIKCWKNIQLRVPGRESIPDDLRLISKEYGKTVLQAQQLKAQWGRPSQAYDGGHDLWSEKQPFDQWEQSSSHWSMRSFNSVHWSRHLQRSTSSWDLHGRLSNLHLEVLY